MKLHIGGDHPEAQWVCEHIEDVRMVFPSNFREIRGVGEYLWVGANRNGSIWALFLADPGVSDIVQSITLLSWLEDPPKQHRDTIAEILSDFYLRVARGARPTDSLIDDVISGHPFPIYRTVGDYLPVAPEAWRDWPAELMLRYSFSEYTVGTARKRKRNSFEDVIEALLEPREPGVLLHYVLEAREVVPLLPYEVDWSLARRGKSRAYERELRVPDGPTPWDEGPNQEIVRVYQDTYSTAVCAPAYWSRPTNRLAVAGKTAEEAEENWHRVARYLRKLMRDVGRSAAGARDGAGLLRA